MGPVPPLDHSIIMELASIKSYQRTIASVELPLKHFIETGFWDPYSCGRYDQDADIGDSIVRRTCRNVARELKRPFIQCFAVVRYAVRVGTGEKSQYGHDLYETVDLPEPQFEYGFVMIPKQKRLAPLATPLLLMPDVYSTRVSGVSYIPAHSMHSATLWRARIYNQDLWNDYYNFVLNDPECRKARKLTP